MERIKDISKLKLQLGSVLIKIYLKQSLIQAPDSNLSNKSQVDYAEVVSFSDDVKDLSVGDIVLDFRTTEGFEWKKNKYAVVPRMNVKVAVTRDNINLGTKVVDKHLN